MDGAADSTRDVESLSLLTGLSRGRFGKIAPERIARYILHVIPEPDWQLRRAALDALARRYGFARRDQLKVAQRPKSSLFGTYRTRSSGDVRRGVRPYDTELLALEPLHTSCGCADFVRGSLGLCKHGLVVLEALEARSGLKRSPAQAEYEARHAVLRWNPLHPLYGAADRLERLQLVAGKSRIEPAGFRNGRPLRRDLQNPENRLAVTIALEKLVQRGRLEAEPAVITLLAEERQRAVLSVANQQASGPAMNSLRTLRRKLYPYQREGVKRFFAAGRLLLADDMGLGKTTQAIAACHGLLETRRVRRGLLIVPASLKSQWAREWSATTHVELTVVEGSPQERARLYASTQRGVLIIGYEQLLRDFEHVQRYAPELVVLDEAQRIKNWATKSAAYVKALAASHRLVLTGTPMENRFAELASIIDFVDDVALEPKWRLLPFHTTQTGDADRGTTGVKHLNVLRERLAPVMLRRVRKDVIAQLPSRTDTRVPVELTSVQRDAHDDLRRPIASLVNRAARRPLRPGEFLQLMQLLTKQRMISNGMAQVQFELDWPRCAQQQPTPQLLESLFAPKLSALRGLVEQIVVGQHRKAIVFSQWRNMLRLAEWAVRDLLVACGQRAVFFTGAESAKLRERAVVDFHDDPQVTMMFLSDAGGVGLNLQRAANCCVNLEMPWNPAVLEQRIGRIYRLGQDQPIDVFNLVSEEGIESRIAGLVERKRAVFSNLFDGTTDAVVFDTQSSFLDGVRRLIDPVLVPVDSGDEAELTSPDDSGADTPEVRQPSAASPQVQLAAVVSGADAAQTPVPGASPLHVEVRPDGSLRIDAPAALAAPLAQLFEQMARSLRAGSGAS